MKIKSMLFVSCLVLMSSLALGDGIPPDPATGVAGGGDSAEIFDANFSFILTPCTSPTTPAGCSRFDHPQAIFAGDNDTGIPWHTLTLTLNYGALAERQSLSCFGGSLFSVNNCPEILARGSTSVTFTFFQGTGTGIGCFDPHDTEGDFNSNRQCLGEVPELSQDRASPGPEFCFATADCLPSPHFLIAVGFNHANWPAGSIPTGGNGQANIPEPGTLALLVTGLGALAAKRRARKK